jgi:hypothetical protein
LGRRNTWLHTQQLRPLLSFLCSNICLQQTSGTDCRRLPTVDEIKSCLSDIKEFEILTQSSNNFKESSPCL